MLVMYPPFKNLPHPTLVWVLYNSKVSAELQRLILYDLQAKARNLPINFSKIDFNILSQLLQKSRQESQLHLVLTRERFYEEANKHKLQVL